MKRIELRDELTLTRTPELLESLAAQLEAPATLLDLAAVTEIDSSAVSLLLACQRRAQARGIELRCGNLPAGLRSLTQLYSVSSLIPDANGDK